ncbi:hypothetical protein BC826DRAFT_651050 [Russula brevipes]|nr:hypothetical protein BC826DRAFT_651050 [Russula brevipes]
MISKNSPSPLQFPNTALGPVHNENRKVSLPSIDVTLYPEFQSKHGKYAPTGRACPSYSATPSRFRGQHSYCHLRSLLPMIIISASRTNGPQGDCPRASRGPAFFRLSGQFSSTSV